MRELTAYCGLDCEKCDARKATVNDDNALREKTAELWSQMNNAEITADMINCMGCRSDGVKTPFCSDLCTIRKCVTGRELSSCGKCPDLEECTTIRMITATNKEALERLRRCGKEVNISE